MLPLVMALVGAGLGAYKGHQDKKAHQKDKELAAATTRYSPWTGMKGQITTRDGNMAGGAVKGGLAGYLGSKNQIKDIGSYQDVGAV